MTCNCGCGRETLIAPRNRKDLGWIKGQPLHFCLGHNRKHHAGPPVQPGYKWCYKCCNVKRLRFFQKSTTAACGRQALCNTCNHALTTAYRIHNRARVRRHNLKQRLKQFNLALADYDALVHKQAGRCAICGQSSTRSLAVDHDHTTGEVRGLLCSKCNTGLGLMRESPSLLSRAIAYLEHK